MIERSATGDSFDSIGVTGAYTFADKNMTAGNNYYRLRCVDNNGNVAYSNMIVLDNVVMTGNTAATAGARLQVYPNPAAATLNYSFNSTNAASVIVQVYSLSGALVMAEQQQMVAGVNEQSLNISSLRSGSYFVKITSVQGSIQLIQQFAKI